MRSLIHRLVQIVALFVALLSVVGCASLGRPTTLKMTRNDADWAMVRFHNRVTFGLPVTPEEQERVKSAYKAYLLGFNQAVKQANGNLDTPTPDDVKQLYDQLANVLASIP